MNDKNHIHCSLNKTERLKSRKAIDLLFEKGKSFSQSPVKVIWLPQVPEKGLQAGFTVSSRHFKKATDRNRVKRLLRECYRLQKNELKQTLQQQQHGLFLFFIYQGRELPAYAEIYPAIGQLLLRVQKKMYENNQ